MRTLMVLILMTGIAHAEDYSFEAFKMKMREQQAIDRCASLDRPYDNDICVKFGFSPTKKEYWDYRAEMQRYRQANEPPTVRVIIEKK